MKLKTFTLLLVCLSVLSFSLAPALCWSNGGYSANPAQPDYGTHDWIAQHALEYLPNQEKQYITSNLAAYLYGTELPDLPASQGGIGDTTKHHIYFYANGTLQDDAAAKRANEEYQKTLTYLKSKDYPNAAKQAGILSHYIDDMAVFCHVMGAKTAWGAENSAIHSGYENYVTDNMKSYATIFDAYLSFDGNLTMTSAYNAALNLAYNSTFGDNGAYSCTWMNSNYDWNNLQFKNRCGESLNLAVNVVADALHSIYIQAEPAPTTTTTVTPHTTVALGTPNPTPSKTPTIPEFTSTSLLAIILILTTLAIIYMNKKTKNKG